MVFCGTRDWHLLHDRSFAKDNTKNGNAGQTNDFNCDIVFQQGQFTAWPQGIQT